MMCFLHHIDCLARRKLIGRDTIDPSFLGELTRKFKKKKHTVFVFTNVVESAGREGAGDGMQQTGVGGGGPRLESNWGLLQ